MTAPRLPNLFKVPELKEKILFTLLCLVVYRVGAHIATPGVNVQALADYLRNQAQGTLFALYDLFAGEQRALRSEEHTSELQSQSNLVCRLLLEKKKKK